MADRSIYKLDDIIKVSPEDTLSHALSLLSSSHDSAFVMEGKKVLGIINPYYCIIKKSYPSNTKVKHCMLPAPKLDINTSLKKVIHLIIESKVHYLPVFSQNELYGIISARRILQSIKDLPELKVTIEKVLKHKQPLVTVTEKDFLSQAINLFKKYRFSKLIVTSKEGRLKGILAYYDLISYLAVPKKNQHQGSREGNKSPMLKQYIKNYMKTIVLTLTPQDTLSKAASMILEKNIGSVVIVDRDKQPIGLITTRDLLNSYLKKSEFPKIELITRHISGKSMSMILRYVHLAKEKLSRGNNKVKVLIKGQKDGRGIFEAVVSIFDKNKVKIIRGAGKNLQTVLEKISAKTKK